MDHYRSYAPDRALKNWGEGDELVWGRTIEEAAERLASVARASGADTLNVRIHVKGLTDDQVRAQIDRHAEGFVPAVKALLT